MGCLCGDEVAGKVGGAILEVAMTALQQRAYQRNVELLGRRERRLAYMHLLGRKNPHSSPEAQA